MVTDITKKYGKIANFHQNSEKFWLLGKFSGTMSVAMVYKCLEQYELLPSVDLGYFAINLMLKIDE